MSNNKSTSQTPCRNILIHGYCRYADKGCIFKHDTNMVAPTSAGSISSDSTITVPAATAPSSAPVTTIKKKLNLNADSPVFIPSFSTPLTPSKNSSTSLAVNSPNVEAAAFIPRTSQASSNVVSNGSDGHSTSPAKQFNLEKVFAPQSAIGADYSSSVGYTSPSSSTSHDAYNTGPSHNGYTDEPDSMGFQNLSVGPIGNTGEMPFSHGNQTTSIYQHHSAYPLNYHLYAPTPLGITKGLLKAHQRTVEDLFVSNDLREELQRKNEATLQAIPGLSLPEFVHVYHSLVPLDTSLEKNTSVFGYPSWAYKVESNLDGKIYCMRRIEGFRLTNEKTMRLLKFWHRVTSPGIVTLHEAFTTRAFGDNSLIFIYDYYPMSVTAYDAYLGPHSVYQHGTGMTLPEDQLWGYAAQLLCALKAIHGRELAARVIEPSRILTVKKGRIRINCVGVLDFLHYENGEVMAELQKADLISCGKVLLSLASLTAEPTAQSLSLVRIRYSKDLGDLIDDLLSGAGLKDTITKYAYHLTDVLDSALFENDNLEAELSKELENGRLVRLLAKFGFINGRPEFEHDSHWSDTGDRYLIKLFRDYVFHQVDEKGHPVVDLNHVLRTLNKLDAGIDEMILLVSRDEQNSLITSYKELKVCMEGAFRELTRRS